MGERLIFKHCPECGKPGTCRELHFCCKPKDDMTKTYHYCAMHQIDTGVTAYLDGVYHLEGATLEIGKVREAAAEAMRAKNTETATAETVLLLSLTKLN